MSGRYGKAASIKDQNVTVCTMPELATINIEVVNCEKSVAYITLAISETDTPLDTDYLEYEVELKGSGVLIRSAVVVEANEKIVVHSTNSNCCVRIHGITGIV
jgi:hypothetical protein